MVYMPHECILYHKLPLNAPLRHPKIIVIIKHLFVCVYVPGCMLGRCGAYVCVACVCGECCVCVFCMCVLRCVCVNVCVCVVCCVCAVFVCVCVCDGVCVCVCVRKPLKRRIRVLFSPVMASNGVKMAI